MYCEIKINEPDIKNTNPKDLLLLHNHFYKAINHLKKKKKKKGLN